MNNESNVESVEYNKIKQLEEENEKLKQALTEVRKCLDHK